ncbi:DUF2500 domain-containing protein [Paenibacillus sp. NPDC056579]|uniref:DUF2500 domain-containing protein n=1 Tax=Paenibacillus sp. NPDC056579 TaxID=3345871 RepID=UPI00367918D8
MHTGFGPPPIFSFMFGLVSFLIIGTIVFVVVRGLTTWTRNNAADVVSVPARIVSKRTNVSGGSGDTSATTTYYITFEFADKERIELQVRGNMYGLLVEGDEGTLVYQGTRFHEFQRQ